MMLNAAVSLEDPVRRKVGLAGIAGNPVSASKAQCPEVVAGFPGSESGCAGFIGDVVAHRTALVPMNAAFPLLEVDRVTGKVPVDQVVTSGVKVETILTHGRAGEHEGPKRVPREMTNPPEARSTRERYGSKPQAGSFRLSTNLSLRPNSVFRSGR